jgi:hypothetical protein
MNVEIGTEAPIFLFWEYLFQIFGILSLQCTVECAAIWYVFGILRNLMHRFEMQDMQKYFVK